MPCRWSAVVCLVVVLLIYGCQAAPVRRDSMPPEAPSAALQGLLLDVRTRRFISFETLVADVATAQVVAVGEEHYHAAIQAFELRLLQALTERRPQHVALGMEFLERDAQATVAAYLDGTIGRTAFRERLAASPAFMELYFPLVRYARLHGLPVVPLNIPRRIARQVAEHGLGKTLERLSRIDQAYLPASLTPISSRYRTYFLAAVAPYHSPQGKQADYFVEASHLKDDTMAQSIGAFLDRHADFTILAIAGRFHFDYGIAIPTILLQQHPQASVRRITTMSMAAEEGIDLQHLAQEDLADYVRFFSPPPTQRSTAATPLTTAGQD